jgi:hypothetical protein
MFRKINNKLLAIVFIALIALVVMFELIDSKKGNRTFKNNLVNVNVENITTIELYPKAANGNLIKIYRENDSWKVESNGEKYNADGSTAIRLISQLNELNTKSVAATSKERWKQFEVTDSLGTRVKLLNGDKIETDVVIGKFSYSQPRNTTSYVRLNNEKEVYGVEGMLAMSFNRDINAFRDRTIIKSNKNDWTKLTFAYPADSSFVLEKKGEKWMIGDITADSALVAQYFTRIANLSDGSFVKDKPKIAATHWLTIEGNNMMQKIEIAGYYTDNENFVLESNLNPDTWINNKSTAEKAFVPMTSLLNAK